jgi:Protein of unknown function (DUF4232)
MVLRRIPIVAVAVAAAALLASCGSGSDSPAVTTTRAQPSAPTSAPSTAPVPSTPPAASRCQNGQLSVVPLSGGVGAGSAQEVIGFTNISAATCTLTGFPGVAALDASGAQVAQAERFTGAQAPAVTTVTLAQGQTASAIVSGTSIPTGAATTCPYYAPALLVTPPNLTRSVKVAMTGSNFGSAGFPGCSVLKVGPVFPGITGQSS